MDHKDDVSIPLPIASGMRPALNFTQVFRVPGDYPHRPLNGLEANGMGTGLRNPWVLSASICGPCLLVCRLQRRYLITCTVAVSLVIMYAPGLLFWIDPVDTERGQRFVAYYIDVENRVVATMLQSLEDRPLVPS